MSTIDGGGEQVPESEMKTTEFDGRVASMLQAGTVRGYLFVTVADSSGADSAGPYFTLEFLRRTSGEDEHTWFYSDRADPTDYDTAAELASATIDWYGTSYTVQWLPDDEAGKIKAYFCLCDADADGRSSQKVIRGAGS